MNKEQFFETLASFFTKIDTKFPRGSSARLIIDQFLYPYSLNVMIEYVEIFQLENNPQSKAKNEKSTILEYGSTLRDNFLQPEKKQNSHVFKKSRMNTEITSSIEKKDNLGPFTKHKGYYDDYSYAQILPTPNNPTGYVEVIGSFASSKENQKYPTRETTLDE